MASVNNVSDAPPVGFRTHAPLLGPVILHDTDIDKSC